MKINDAMNASYEASIRAIQSCSQDRVFDSVLNKITKGADIYDKGVVAQLLNNYTQIKDSIISEQGSGFTKGSDFGPIVNEVWPLVAAWYPEFPLKDLISVQAMNKPLAYLAFSELKAGTNKAGTQIGDVVETALGARVIRGQYPTGEIFGEVIEGDDITATDGGHAALLAYSPLNISAIPGYLDKVKITIGDNVYVPLNVVNNTISLTKQGESADSGITIGIADGLLTIPTKAEADVTKVTANYVWNIEYGNVDNIMRVKEEIVNRPLEATPRALMLEWTVFSEFLKKSQFGTDIKKENSQRMLNLMYQYQVRYILDELYDYAAGNGGKSLDVVLPGSQTISLDVKAQTVIQRLKEIATMVERASGRVEGNRLVVGRNFKSFLESLPSQWFTPASTNALGYNSARELGTFASFKVYYDPERKDNEAFMSYKANDWYDAPYYLGSYMPLVPTEAVPLGVKVSSAFVSMEAYRYDKPNTVFKLNIGD